MQLLSSKLAGRFIPPNPFNSSTGNAVNTPALLLLNYKKNIEK